MGKARSCRATEGCAELIVKDGADGTISPDGAAFIPQRRKFYGRRKGRKLSHLQNSLLSDSLGKASLRIGGLSPDETALRDLFACPVNDVWLEIGFGAGEHLLWQAANNSAIGFIGAEPFVNGVATTLASAEAKTLSSRIRIHADDVTPLLDWLPEASIGRAFMLFPDPWPKKRHRERRLFSESLASKLTRIMKHDAEFRFASDIPDYAGAALAIAHAHPSFDVERVFTSESRDAVPDWPVTRYERKAIAAGRTSTFFVLTRNA